MCNFCNSGTVVSGCGCGSSGYVNTATANGACGYTNTATSGCGCGCGNSWFGVSQSICRDCCGNIRIRQNGCSSCGCYQSKNESYGCGYANTATSGCRGTVTAVPYTANGFAYLNVGGNTCYTANASTTTTSGDLYYARQYGLLGRSSCPCSVSE